MTDTPLRTFRWATTTNFGPHYNKVSGMHEASAVDLDELVAMGTGPLPSVGGVWINNPDGGIPHFIPVDREALALAFERLERTARSQPIYVASEPEEVTSFKDQRGGLHETRDAAIAANFEQDLMGLIMDYCRQEQEEGVDGDALVPLQFRRFVKHIAKREPDVLRVLVGDRDAT